MRPAKTGRSFSIHRSDGRFSFFLRKNLTACPETGPAPEDLHGRCVLRIWPVAILQPYTKSHRLFPDLHSDAGGKSRWLFPVSFCTVQDRKSAPRCLKPFLKLQHDARHRAKRDQHNGMQLFEVQDKGACSRKHRHPDPVETGSRHQRGLKHRNPGRRNQSRHRRPQSREHIVHPAIGAELLQELRNDADDDHRRHHQSDGRGHRPQNVAACDMVAHISGHVHADGTRGGLADSNHVHEIRCAEPVIPVHHLLQKRNRCQASAHGKQSCLEEFEEQRQQQFPAHDCTPFRVICSCHSTPAAAASITMTIVGTDVNPAMANAARATIRPKPFVIPAFPIL